MFNHIKWWNLWFCVSFLFLFFISVVEMELTFVNKVSG